MIQWTVSQLCSNTARHSLDTHSTPGKNRVFSLAPEKSTLPVTRSEAGGFDFRVKGLLSSFLHPKIETCRLPVRRLVSFNLGSKVCFSVFAPENLNLPVTRSEAGEFKFRVEKVCFQFSGFSFATNRKIQTYWLPVRRLVRLNLRETWFGFHVEWETEGGLDSNSAHHSPEPDATTTTHKKLMRFWLQGRGWNCYL